MSELIQRIASAEEITGAAQRLRKTALEKDLSPKAVLEVFEQWAAALDAPGVREIPGVAFLRLWLRRGTLEPSFAARVGPGIAGWRVA